MWDDASTTEPLLVAGGGAGGDTRNVAPDTVDAEMDLTIVGSEDSRRHGVAIPVPPFYDFTTSSEPGQGGQSGSATNENGNACFSAAGGGGAGWLSSGKTCLTFYYAERADAMTTTGHCTSIVQRTVVALPRGCAAVTCYLGRM